MTIKDFENFSKTYYEVFRKTSGNTNGSCDGSCERISHNNITNGTIAVMCPKCYSNTKHIVSQKTSVMSSSSIDGTHVRSFAKIDYTICECKSCSAKNVKGIELDPNIANAISILNKKGYYTKYCCEGHNNNDSPYIRFNDLDILNSMDTLPLTWNIDYVDLRYHNHLVIRADGWDRNEAMFEILEWAKNLESRIWRYGYH